MAAKVGYEAESDQKGASEQRLTGAYLRDLKERVNDREANAVTDYDAESTPINTQLLRRLITAAEKGVQAESLVGALEQLERLLTFGYLSRPGTPMQAEEMETARQILRDVALKISAWQQAGVASVEEVVTL